MYGFIYFGDDFCPLQMVSTTFFTFPLYITCNFQVRVEAIDKGDRNRRNRVTVSVIIKYKDTNQHPPAFIPVEQGGM